MRSYSYEAGKWTTCEDKLPPTAYWELHGGSENSKKADTFKAILEKIGFDKNGSDYLCVLGPLKVHARDHALLSLERTKAYDFLCTLRVDRSYIRVWIPDLPNLLLFMREVDGKAEEGSVEGAIKSFLKDSDYNALSKFLWNTAAAMDHFRDGYAHVTVEQEVKEPPKKRLPRRG